MVRLTTELMNGALRAHDLMARNPGLAIGISDGPDGALGLYEARARGRVIDVDTRLSGLLDRLEALEAAERTRPLRAIP